jgi:TolB-like protein
MALRALLTGSAGRMPRPGRARGNSLAVLPFVNTGADPQLEYLTDGITESIINTLSQVSTLRVVPRSLVFRYKGLQADPATVGLALNARTILTGRVTQQGDVLNVQAELVDTVTESQLWGEQYRLNLADVMTVQEQIAWQISEALRLKLSRAQKQKLRKRHTVSPEAYEAYLRGRHYWNNWGPESFRKALEYFSRAIEIDPAYALAYAGLGDAYGALSYYGFIPPADGFPRARAAALRAIELDPDNADAHVTLGLERLFWGWDWPTAERELKLAIERNPKLSRAHTVYGLYLVTAGRFAEALQEARLGRDLDPLSPFSGMGVAWVHHFAGNHEGAAEEATRARQMTSAHDEAGNVLINAYENMGRFEDAARLMTEQRCWTLALDGGKLLAAYRAGGPDAYWRKRLELMNEVGADAPPGIRFAYAVVHTHIGDYEAALADVEAMEASHAGGTVFLGVDPCLHKLRGQERYEQLLRRVGSPMASAPHTVSS